MTTIAFKRLTKTAKLPTRGSEQAAGLDLYADLDTPVKVYPGQVVLISTGIALAQMPEGCYGRVAPRSGMAVRGSDVFAGVVDADYRGEIMVVLYGAGQAGAAIVVQPGDRVAQLIVEKYNHVEVVELEEIGDTKRASNGFGSTGA